MAITDGISIGSCLSVRYVFVSVYWMDHHLIMYINIVWYFLYVHPCTLFCLSYEIADMIWARGSLCAQDCFGKKF